MASHTLAPFPPELLAAKKQIREQARSYGLDFFPVIFEMCDYEQMNQIAAYGGFPQRYPHWRFGMEYEALRKQHHYGLGRIYEMVINNDPCYAYLQESNALWSTRSWSSPTSTATATSSRTTYWFSQTNRKMMDEMANHSTRVRKHIEKHGYDTSKVAGHLPLRRAPDRPAQHVPQPRPDRSTPPASSSARGARKHASSRPRITWTAGSTPKRGAGGRGEEKSRRQSQEKHATPARPTRDVLLYLLQHARWKTGRSTASPSSARRATTSRRRA
jgi:stage V sporulation protein R